jgi:hypothetical protein
MKTHGIMPMFAMFRLPLLVVLPLPSDNSGPDAGKEAIAAKGHIAAEET